MKQNPFTVLPKTMPAEPRRHRAIALAGIAVLLVLFGFVAARPTPVTTKGHFHELSRR